MTHPTTRTASHALIDVCANVGHNDLSGLLADLAGVVRKNGALSVRCRDSVIDQLDELMDEIDQDLRNQQAEQAWSDKQSREAGFVLSPADRVLAAEVAALSNKTLEIVR